MPREARRTRLPVPVVRLAPRDVGLSRSYGAERMREKPLGWLEAMGCWIEGVGLACPLFIGAVVVSLLGSELYGVFVSGTQPFRVGAFLLVVFLAIPILTFVLTILLILPLAPVGALALRMRERGSGGWARLASGLVFILLVLATGFPCLWIVSLLLETSDGSPGAGTILGCFTVAALAQGTILALATRMARDRPI